MVTLDTGNRFCNNTRCVGVSQKITQEEIFLTGALCISLMRGSHTSIKKRRFWSGS